MLSTSSDNSFDENNSFVEFKYLQDSRFRLRTTQWKISDKDLTDAGPSNANINLEQKFGNVKKCHHTISGDKLVFRCEDCNWDFKNEKGLKTLRTRIHGLMNQSFLCESFSSKIDKTRRKNETIKIKLHLLPWIMRSNSVPKIIILVDFNDYLVPYVLENILRIITD
jgi:hypothetical protein